LNQFDVLTNQKTRGKMNKAQFHTALIALAAFAICSFVQNSVMKVPVIGAYLPGGSTAA
jgi:hypothetical protein